MRSSRKYLELPYYLSPVRMLHPTCVGFVLCLVRQTFAVKVEGREQSSIPVFLWVVERSNYLLVTPAPPKTHLFACRVRYEQIILRIDFVSMKLELVNDTLAINLVLLTVT